jgi:hypothetical protein
MTSNLLKQSVLFISIFLSVFYVQAQSFQFSGFQLELKSAKNLEKATLPFKALRVLDKRFDSSKLGYAFFSLQYKNILLNSSLSTGIEDYFKDNFICTPASDKILVIVLRTLWMHEMKSGEEDIEDFNNETRSISKYILKADIYSLQNNSYQALARIDTVFKDILPLKNISAQLLANSLNYTARKISSLNLEQLSITKTKISEKDVMNYYDQRFKKPRIIHDTLQRGIYLNFNDFLNNHPTLYKFTLEQDEESDYLYIEENGEEKLFTDFWGFSDGDNLYVKLGFNFFKLTRDNNTYSFWGCRQAVHKTPSRNKNRVVRYMAFGNLANLRSAKLKNILRPMQLDMETGSAY